MPDPISITSRRVLVVCYSLNGHTRRLALDLARQLRADIETLGDKVNRHGVLGHARSAIEALLHIRPSLPPSRCSPRDYALVVICTPVWAWNMASPVRSWIHQHSAELPRVALVCTYGGSGHAKVLDDLQALCGKPALTRLAMSAERIDQKTYMRRLQGFADRILAAVPMPSGEAQARAA